MRLLERLQACAGNATSVIGLGGEGGSEIVSNTTARTGEYKAIQVLDDTVFDASTAGNMIALGGASIAAGTILHGLWSSVKLTSGRVVLYNC